MRRRLHTAAIVQEGFQPFYLSIAVCLEILFPSLLNHLEDVGIAAAIGAVLAAQYLVGALHFLAGCVGGNAQQVCRLSLVASRTAVLSAVSWLVPVLVRLEQVV